MKKLTLVGLTAAFLTLAAAPAHGHGWLRGCRTACAPVCDVQIVWEEREVTAYRCEWKEREVKVWVNKLFPKEEVRHHECKVLVPEWKDEKRKVTVMVAKPREVEREVCRCVMVRECCVDPCTGCVRTVCRPKTVVEKVRCTVYGCVPQEREVTVRVCHYREEVRKWDTKCTVWECKRVEETCKQCYCEWVPYKTKVKVPVCVPVVHVCCTACCCP